MPKRFCDVRADATLQSSNVLNAIVPGDIAARRWLRVARHVDDDDRKAIAHGGWGQLDEHSLHLGG